MWHKHKHKQITLQIKRKCIPSKSLHSKKYTWIPFSAVVVDVLILISVYWMHAIDDSSAFPFWVGSLSILFDEIIIIVYIY